MLFQYDVWCGPVGWGAWVRVRVGVGLWGGVHGVKLVWACGVGRIGSSWVRQGGAQ